MAEGFDRDHKKSHNKNLHKKHKKIISEDQKFVNKANKAFKHRMKEIKEEEVLEDIEYYDRLN